jgi:hypothetical protein
MGLSKLILETVRKYLKRHEKRCQGLVTVTVTVTYKKRKINRIFSFAITKFESAPVILILTVLLHPQVLL